jgi:hypothetical protein
MSNAFSNSKEHCSMDKIEKGFSQFVQNTAKKMLMKQTF